MLEYYGGVVAEYLTREVCGKRIVKAETSQPKILKPPA